MRKMFLLSSIIVFCLFLTSAYVVLAQTETTSNTQQSETVANATEENTASEANWKQELGSDKQQIDAQKQEISQNSQESRAEEDQLRQQIKTAMDSGDIQTAEQLKEQLKSVHQENLQQKMQDVQNMQSAKQDFKNDAKEAQQEGYLPPKDQDINPPGPVGGPGAGVGKPQEGPRVKR